MNDELFGCEPEYMPEMQERLNAIQSRLAEYVRESFAIEPCSCGKPVVEHCVDCGACLDEECNDSHQLAVKFGRR